MAEPLSKVATYADLEAVPDHLVAEILFGQFVVRPISPTIREGLARTALAMTVGRELHKRGYILLSQAEVRIGGHVIVPDLSCWRIRDIADTCDATFIDFAPEWVCEVLADCTEIRDRGDKSKIYAQHGVKNLWLIDPAVQSLECLRCEADGWKLNHVFFESEDVRAEPFDYFTFPLSDLWPFDPPTNPSA